MLTLKVTDEIILKQIDLSDAPDIFRVIDEERTYLGKWLPFVVFTQGVTDSENFINSIYAEPAWKQELVFVIHYEGRFVGIAGFKSTDKANRKTEIGYWLSEAWQSKGIVTQSVRTLLGYAFNDLQMNRVQIKCAVDNIPSKKIPERLGFELEGIERDGELLTGGRFTDLMVYSMLKKEWEKLSK